MELNEYWNKFNEMLESSKIASYMDACNPLGFMFKESAQVGIDIGSHSVKIVVLKEMPRSVSVMSIGYKELAPSLDSGNSRLDLVLIQNEIKKLLKECKVKAKRVALTISDTAVVVQQIKVPRLSEKELGKAVKWRAEKYISFPLEQAVVDFQDLGLDIAETGEDKDIVVVVAHNDTINKYISMLREVKVMPTKVDIAAFSVIKAFLRTHEIEKDKMVALIDIGARRSVLTIIKGGKLLFMRTIDIAGDTFTDAIKKGTGVGFQEAETMKKAQPLKASGRGSEHGEIDLFPHIEASLMQFVGEINRSFAYCEAEILIDRIEKVFLFGGGALFKGMDAFLAEKLGVSVERGNVFTGQTIKMKKRDSEKVVAVESSLTAAFGAALL